MLDRPLVDVLDLIKGLMEHNKRQPMEDTGGERIRNATGQRMEGNTKVIYRKADDSWF